MKKSNLKNLAVCFIFAVNFTSVLSAEIIPLSSESNSKYLPVTIKSLNGDSEDGILTCWLEDSENGSLKIQKTGMNGELIWDENAITVNSGLGTSFTSDSDYPNIYSDNSGGAVIIYRKVFTTSDEIYSSKITSEGKVTVTENLSSHYGGYNFCPRSVNCPDNTIAVVWENFNGGNFDIHSQKINMNGDKLWNNGNEVVVCRQSNDQRKPNIICDQSNKLIITWLDDRNSATSNEYSMDLFANKLDENGNYTEYGNTGKLIFDYNYSVSNFNNKGKNNNLINRNGKGPGKIQKVILYNHNMVLSENNSLIFAVDLWLFDIDSYIDIFKIDSNLNQLWESIIEEESFQYNPLIVSDGNYGACIVWNDKRNNMNNIYEIKIDKFGNKVSGSANGNIVSFGNNSSDKKLANQYNPGGIHKIENQIFIPWVDSEKSDLFLTEFHTGDSGFYKNLSAKIGENVSSSDFISTTSLRNKSVLVFVSGNQINLSMETFKKKINVNENKISINNFPNPFNPATKIKYEIPDGQTGQVSFVTLKVYDISGKEVVTLVNENQSSGIYEVSFSSASSGVNLPSGVYYAKIVAQNGLSKTYTAVRKMILVK